MTSPRWPLSQAQKDPRAYTNSGAFTSFDAPRLFTLLTGVAICLAAIVWLNVAGLTLASALERIRIYSLQSVLGATRAVLIRAAVFENAIPTAGGQQPMASDRAALCSCAPTVSSRRVGLMARMMPRGNSARLSRDWPYGRPRSRAQFTDLGV